MTSVKFVSLLIIAQLAYLVTPVAANESKLDFAVCGVKLGTDFDEFQNLLPSATEGRQDNAVEMPLDHVVLVNNGTTNPLKVFFRFRREKVYSIAIEYSREAVATIKDAASVPIIAQLEAKLGPCTHKPSRWRHQGGSNERTLFAWYDKERGRFISFQTCDDGSAQLFVRTYSAAEEELKFLPTTPLLGFGYNWKETVVPTESSTAFQDNDLR